MPSLSVHPGEFLVVCGSSGSGKSTLTDMLGLLLRPDAAEAFQFQSRLEPIQGRSRSIDLMRSSGRALSALRRQRLGYVLQSGGLLGFLSVRRNILLAAKLNRTPAAQAEVLRLARTFGITDQLSKKPRFLSGGQRQRAAIARALVHSPEIILADEPTASVDRFTAAEIVAELHRVTRETGSAVVMVTHDLELVRSTADRFYSMQAERAGAGLTRARCLETFTPASTAGLVPQIQP